MSMFEVKEPGLSSRSLDSYCLGPNVEHKYWESHWSTVGTPSLTPREGTRRLLTPRDWSARHTASSVTAFFTVWKISALLGTRERRSLQAVTQNLWQIS